MNIQGSEMEFGDKFSYVIRDLKDAGIYEAKSIELLKQHIRPTDICADVGAHIGYYTLIMSKLGYQVLAFEPLKYNFDLLNNNVNLNNYHNVKTYQFALSDYDGIGHLSISDICTGMNHLDEEGVHTVVHRMDFVTNRIDVLKIDAEGYEEKVLWGLGKIKPRVILIEDVPEIRQARGFNPDELYRLLTKDYRFNKVDNNLFCVLK